ncbi:MAG: hypothetical protein NT031_10235, partial [Planctomycetota bacterium]|nr:hypothetical protein [Planctomycetota bacterium]
EACQRRILTPDLPDIWDAARGSWISGVIALRSILPESILVIPGVKVNPPAPGPKSSLTPTPAPTATTPPKPPTPTPPKPATVTPPRPPTVTPPKPPAPAVAKPAVGTINVPTVQVVVQSSRDAESIYLWCLQANVKPGSTYRYRVRLAFINPLLGRDTLAKHIEESKIKTVESPWSAWSEPVTVVRPIRFFLVNKVTEGQVRVAVFAHAMGRWVRRDYTVAQGDPIGHAEPQQKVLNPLTGKEQEMSVDFSTGTVAMDFSETAVVLPTGRTVVGVEMIYLDEDGRLKAQANVMADRAAPAAKEYEALDKQSQPEPKRMGTGAGGQ